MKRDRILNFVYIAFGVVIIALVVWGVLMLQRNQRIGEKSTKTVQSETSEMSADKKLVCKTELIGLYNQAKAIGADGMLTLDSSADREKECVFIIRNMSAPGDLGTIRASSVPEGGTFGITLEIDRSREDQIHLWSIAALLYLNHQNTEQTAAEAVDAALSDGSVASELYTISARDSVRIEDEKVTATKSIKITGFQSGTKN